MEFHQSPGRARRAAHLAALLGTSCFIAIAASGAAFADAENQDQTQKQIQTQPKAPNRPLQQLAAAAPAAPANGPPVVTAQATPPEQVLITGSLIGGTPAVGVPVNSLSQGAFVETGALTIPDILKSVPALHIDAEASPTYGGGTLSFEQNVQIHGLGTGSGVETLLLVNGLRFPPQNYSNDTVNPSIIPPLAIDHLDVLTAGASAVYGSDATAGVINIILKRGYEGAMTQASISSAPGEGYLQLQAGQLYGHKWETGDVTVSYTWTNSRAVRGDRRSYYTMDFTPWGLMDITPEASSIPAVVHVGNQKTVAGAPALETSSSGTLFCANCFSVPKGQNGIGLTWAQILQHPGLTNERNPWADADVRPRTDWNQATITLDQQLTNDFLGLGSISAFADGFWSNQRGKQVYPAGNGQARQNYNKNIPLPTINPFYPIGAPTGLTVDFNLALDIPTLTVGGEVANRWDAGLNFDSLPFGWTGKYTFSITDDHNYGDNPNTVNPQNVSAALGNVVKDTTFGTGATLTKPSSVPYLNPFCDSSAFHNCQDPATLAFIQAYRLQHERWWLQEQDINFNGPIFDLPGGAAKVAIAGQYLNEHWTYTNTSNYDTFDTAFVNNGTDAASQSSYAIFGQADIPIFGEGFQLPLVESLLVELGYRYDRYNNLSNPVWTPKVAVNWLVGDGLTFRGAWGKSFRVPSFAENSPGGSRVAGLNPFGGATNATNSTIFTCPAGSATAPAGSATAILNPNCLTDEAHTQPGGVAVQLSGNGAAAVLRGHGLSPQTLYQWSLGFNFTPTQPLLGIDLTGLNVDVSWFHLYFRGLIEGNSFGKDDPSNPLSIVEFHFLPNPNLPITDPANASFLNLIKALAAVPNRGGFAFDLNFITNIKFIQDTALINVGKRDFGGIDFDFRYDYDLGKIGFENAGALNIGAAGYYEITDKSRASDTSPVDFIYKDQDSGSHLKRVRYRLGWANDIWNATVFANYFGHGQFGNGQNVAGAKLVPPCFYAPGFAPGSCFPGSPYYGPLDTFPNMTPAVVFWDISLGYTTSDRPANPYLRNIALQLNVNDVFDKPPPFQVGARGNGSIRAFDNAYPDLQRTFTFTITKTW